jgi:undecaprenyl-diphosphatase
VALSVVGSFGLVWIVLSALVAVVRRRLQVFLLVTSGVFLADLLALAVKLLTQRSRPYIREPELEPLIKAALDLSFPSGHAATAFAGATLLASRLPRLAIPLFLLAAGVAWSRVYVGVHYPLDVLVGAVLGIAVGVTLAYLGRAAPRARARALRSPRAGPPRSPRARPPD